MGNFELDLPKFHIEQGYITGFVGANGAGKTTTIKLMMNMLFADDGEIKVFGKDVRHHEVDIKKHIGYIGDPLGYSEDQRLNDTAKVMKYFYQDWDNELYSKYMKQFDLNGKSKFKELSMGQKKQFALTIALAHRPKLLLRDEPTANLDPVVRNYILSILRSYMQDEEVSIFYSTHVTTDLDKACDYVAYLQ